MRITRATRGMFWTQASAEAEEMDALDQVGCRSLPLSALKTKLMEAQDSV